MPDIPQANQLNPALFKICRIYVELPVLNARLNIRNTGFGFHDAIQRGTGVESNTYFVDVSNLDRKLKRINYAQIQTDIDILGFGFGFKDWYFTFGISNHSDILFNYPHDVLLLRDDYLQSVSTSGALINVNHPGVEGTIWNSIGVSAAKEIREGLKVGVRLKYLQGMANVTSRNSDILLNYTASPAALEASIKNRIDASLPVNIGNGPNGAVESLNFSNAFSNIPGDYFFNGNRGAAIDAGFVFDRDELTEFSGSITDLGFISWKKNTNIFTATGNYLFNGIDLANIQANGGDLNLVAALRDSIARAFRNTKSTYLTLVPVKIFGGITHVIMPGLRAGAMTRIEIYNLHVLPSLTLSMNYTPIPALAASVSYTFMNNKLDQIGAGIALGNRVAQFYLITDNIILRYTKDNQSTYSWPYNARMVSLRFGINLLFGCNKKDNKFHPGNRKDFCPAYW
jgi:hypothetical protein